MSAPEPSRCPRCGTPTAGTQEYCLECGLRLPAEQGAFARWSARAGSRWPWFPGEWIWPAALSLVVAVAGGALAIAASGGAPQGARTYEVATGGSVRPTVTEALPTAPEPTTAPPAATERPPATTPPPRRPGLVAWPTGKNGWTIVLLSLPKTAGLDAARARAREALAARLPQPGVLDSSRFTTLHPGYYVVFTGIYDSQAEATSALQRARAAYPAAYTRQIAS